ncbi:AAA family ATPase [Alcaligenes aquatilis]|uniref:ATP-binding protein n=1 Tax=Alcaligenes aquatilis TaxID=323284 RepID=A0A3G2HTE7_9BURK|nr:AAA family ATPase [Alcaligenes aquatilis]AYN20413.1 ATP-binding protein [Alcaligenes aquatilis]
MTHFKITLEYIQHIASLNLTLDLSAYRLICLVGRNGTGKTTLVRALRNLANSDTFLKTATPYAFSSRSRINYTLGQENVSFTYDDRIRSLNCETIIPNQMRSLVSAELPMPHGMRFNYFKSASEADMEIRKAIALGSHSDPQELISFLCQIYGSGKYSSMIEVEVKGKSYYALVGDNNKYIREDYLSSGEYFLINLYRTIKGSAQLIVIDEIDISLDSAAQANLAVWIREFCAKYRCTILFTTHSLALMRQLEERELFYIDENNGHVSIEATSYGYAKARLFGFSGWDRYILTEDEVLLGFIEALIKSYCPKIFYKYKIIFIGGGTQVFNLLRYNEREQFLSDAANVIAIVDGDQRKEHYTSQPYVYTIPLESVEKSLYAEFQEDVDFPFKTDKNNFSGPKDFNNFLVQKNIATQNEIFEYLIQRNKDLLGSLVEVLRSFLNPSI